VLERAIDAEAIFLSKCLDAGNGSKRTYTHSVFLPLLT